MEKEEHLVDSCVAVFTKPARPGRVKTRLIGALDAERAAALHGAFLGDVLDTLGAGRFRTAVAWALDGADEPFPTMPETVGLEVFRQRGADLGERLFHGLAHLAERYPWVAAVGSDHPELSVATVEEAFGRLAAGADLVLGPSEDGGYYLVAVHRGTLARRLFEGVPWSTAAVLETTLERAAELALEPSLLPVGTDVDVAADLERLESRLAAGELACPRTRRLLTAWGRLGVPTP